MEKTIYSPEQIKTLLSNPNVEKFSGKSVTYSKAFKLKAVKAYYEEGQGPNTIFLNAGFDLNVIGRHKPKSCLKLWRKVYKTKGAKALAKENRGHSGGHKAADKLEDILYLQTKIAYLEAENNFLRKLKTNTKN